MNQETTPTRRNLKLALLAGTCLTTGASVARGATVVESTDFANSVAEALLVPLPFGTDNVTGNVTSVTDNNDFVAFTSLAPGGSFTLAFTGSFTNFDVFDSSSVHVGSPAGVSGVSSATFTGTVPADGKLVAQVGYNEGNPYTITLTAATAVPEPDAAALAGLGVAAAALRRSRRSKKA
ncbi:MAG: PEP-CTERM sorting domain-containing protein [Luteolibacter sp.]